MWKMRACIYRPVEHTHRHIDTDANTDTQTDTHQRIDKCNFKKTSTHWSLGQMHVLLNDEIMKHSKICSVCTLMLILSDFRYTYWMFNDTTYL